MPLVLEKEIHDPGLQLRAFLTLPHAVWLDSNKSSDHPLAQTSYITALPSNTSEKYGNGDIATVLRSLQQPQASVASPRHGFSGGVIGILEYEALDISAPTTACGPGYWAGRYDWYIGLHQDKDRACLHILPSCPPTIREQVLGLWESVNDSDTPPPQSFQLLARWLPEMPRSDYAAAFSKIKDYIAAGDCYQVNLCQSHTSRFSGDPIDAFLAARSVSPVPFGAYLCTVTGSVLSFSPERFLALKGREITTSPIKGTAPTSPDPTVNQQNAANLAKSPKDLAENLMIVDLLRNDIGQFAVTGSVVADPVFSVETFRQVHHLVSTIRAELAPGKDAVDLLLGCFPGGSITGAPKKRAMEIIRELEPVRRSVYCGSIFYINDNGDMDSSITIRTLHCEHNGTIRAWAGGGITDGSDCDKEYEECQHKIGALLHSLESRFLAPEIRQDSGDHFEVSGRPYQN